MSAEFWFFAIMIRQRFLWCAEAFNSFYCETGELEFVANFIFRNVCWDAPRNNFQDAIFRKAGGVKCNIICMKSFLHESGR